jgi:hypothetical protein
LNIDFDLVNVKYKLKYADDVFQKYRTKEANALGEINSKNRAIISGKKKVSKIIIHFAVAAHEYSNVVGVRFSADYSLTYLLQYLKFSDYQVVSIKNTKPFGDLHTRR